MPVIEIGAKNFIQGESQTDDISDRGFSPDSVNLNLTRQKGVLYFREAITDRGGATLTGNIIASCEDPAFSGNDGYFIDDEANFYTIDGATFTKRATRTLSYVLGTTDLIPFNDANFYFTSTTTMGQFNNNMGTVTENWWTGLSGSYRHPLEVVEKELFLADQNVIYYYDGTTSGTAFTLPAGQNVTTLRKHPDGKTLLAFTGSTANASHTRNGTGKVYYCQPTLRGASIEGWTREVSLEAQVEGSRLSGGVVYVTWGTKFGYFDGNGLVPLKNFESSTTTYSQNIKNLEDLLIFRDGLNVVAFGDLGGGGRVFWKLFRNTTNSQHINNLHYKGDNKLLIAFSDGSGGGKLEEVDYDNAGVVGSFYTNRISAGTEIRVHRIDVVHDQSDGAGTTTFTLASRDTEDSESTLETRSYVNQGARKSRFQVDVKDDIVQFKLSSTTDAIGFKLIRIYYEPLK